MRKWVLVSPNNALGLRLKIEMKIRPENPGCIRVKDETVPAREGHHDATDVFPTGSEIEDGLEFLRVGDVAERNYGFRKIPVVFFKRVRTFPASSFESFALERLFTKGL